LREVRTEIKLMEDRVESLQREFEQNFDPHLAQTIRQQQAYKFQPNQVPIVFVNSDFDESKVLNLLP
jgi:hypothetical protein